MYSQAHTTVRSPGREVTTSAGVLALIAVAAAYLNAVGFGFGYDLDDQTYTLGLVNWLRDRALYPNDPIRLGYSRYPTVFWHGVAFFSHFIGTLAVLWIAFILTKLIFFTGLTRLVNGFVKNRVLVALVVCSLALSPLLNEGTPFGSSKILGHAQDQTLLAIALLVWVTTLALERRWIAAAILLGIAVYINGLFTIFMLIPLGVLGMTDLRQQPRKVLSAAAVAAVVAFPSLWLFRGQFPERGAFPPHFVQTWLWRYPYPVVLGSHTWKELLQGAALLTAAGVMVGIAVKLKASRFYRLELLTGTFLAILLICAIVGELLPFPEFVVLQPLRVDSFLFLFSMTLVPMYGARILLEVGERFPARASIVGISAILFPLFAWQGWYLLFGAAFLILAGEHQIARLYQRASRRAALAVPALIGGVAVSGLVGVHWGPAKIAVLAALALPMVLYRFPWQQRLLSFSVATPCVLVIGMALTPLVHTKSQLWNPMIPMGSEEAAWREVQLWAKENTSRETMFMVPPQTEGFRVFSERSSWVDWKDGDIFSTFPEYANEWRRRLSAIGVHPVPGRPYWSTSLAQQQYKDESWGHLCEVAKENNISYVIQSSDVAYGLRPVFANSGFAVYPALNCGTGHGPR